MPRDYSAGTKFEKLYVKQYGGELVTDKAQQNKDIDILHKDGRTVSIKNQTKGSAKSGNISLELEQFNTKTNKSMPGNFELCEADELSIAVTYKGNMCWLHLPANEFKAWVNKWKDKDWKTRTLLPYNIDINKREGRFFDNARNLLIPIDVVANRFRGCLEWLESE